MKITLLGLGMGAEDTLTLGGRKALMKADAILGAQRLLDGLPQNLNGEKASLIRPRDIIDWIQEHDQLHNVCIVFSGDTGFYSGARALRAQLLAEGFQPETICGVSSVSYLCAKLGVPWQDVHLCASGKDSDILAHVLNHEKVFFLTGSGITPRKVCRVLCEAGLADTQITVAERLSYPDERIVTWSAGKLLMRDFSPLSSIFVHRQFPVFHRRPRTVGIPDKEFARGNMPMIKQEVRSTILSKLEIGEDDVLYEIGARCGALAVEMALVARMGRVYAVEESSAGCALIGQNRKKFGVYNLVAVEGSAPDACEDLPVPDAAFIGGSNERLWDILDLLLQKNPRIRVAISAVPLESLSRGLEVLEALDYVDIEALQIAVSQVTQVGPGRMLQAENPVFILSARGNGQA